MTSQEEFREKILAESLMLFGKNGYYDVTTKEIADQCQTTESTLFRYFPTKADLFIAVRDKYQSRGIPELEQMQQPEYLDLVEDHIRLAKAYIKASFANIYLFNMLTGYFEGVPMKTPSRYPLDVMETHYRNYLREAVREKLLPEGKYEMAAELFPAYFLRMVLDLANHDAIFELTPELKSHWYPQVRVNCRQYVDNILKNLSDK